MEIKIDEELSLKTLVKGDASELFDLVDRNRDYLRQWLPWLDRNTTVEDTEAFITAGIEQYDEGNGFQAAIVYQGKIAGVIGFHKTDWANFKTTIGYWLGEEYQGKGIMTRACRAVIDYIFRDMGLNRVEILCAVDNLKSRAIPERLGFTQEGIIRQGEHLYHRKVDLVIYGILADEWPAE